MSIEQELRTELKEAMRQRDQRRLDVIRQVESELALVKTAPGFKGPVDDGVYRQVIAAYVKKMDKARQEFLAAGERGREMAAQLEFEVGYLARWLPRKLDEEQTRTLVKQTIAELGISSPKQIGQLVGHLMKSRGEELDGALVNRLAREALQSS